MQYRDPETEGLYYRGGSGGDNRGALWGFCGYIIVGDYIILGFDDRNGIYKVINCLSRVSHSGGQDKMWHPHRSSRAGSVVTMAAHFNNLLQLLLLPDLKVIHRLFLPSLVSRAQHGPACWIPFHHRVAQPFFWMCAGLHDQPSMLLILWGSRIAEKFNPDLFHVHPAKVQSEVFFGRSWNYADIIVVLGLSRILVVGG